MYASVDLGGTTVACALASSDGQIIADESIPTQSNEGPQTVLVRGLPAGQRAGDHRPRNSAVCGNGRPGAAGFRTPTHTIPSEFPDAVARCSRGRNAGATDWLSGLSPE